MIALLCDVALLFFDVCWRIVFKRLAVPLLKVEIVISEYSHELLLAVALFVGFVAVFEY